MGYANVEFICKMFPEVPNILRFQKGGVLDLDLLQRDGVSRKVGVFRNVELLE